MQSTNLLSKMPSCTPHAFKQAHTQKNNLREAKTQADCKECKMVVLICVSYCMASSQFERVSTSTKILEQEFIGTKSLRCPGRTLKAHSALSIIYCSACQGGLLDVVVTAGLRQTHHGVAVSIFSRQLPPSDLRIDHFRPMLAKHLKADWQSMLGSGSFSPPTAVTQDSALPQIDSPQDTMYTCIEIKQIQTVTCCMHFSIPAVPSGQR